MKRIVVTALSMLALAALAPATATAGCRGRNLSAYRPVHVIQRPVYIAPPPVIYVAPPLFLGALFHGGSVLPVMRPMPVAPRHRHVELPPARIVDRVHRRRAHHHHGHRY